MPNKTLEPVIAAAALAAQRLRRWPDLVTQFEDLQLHDATLLAVSIAWPTQETHAEVMPAQPNTAVPRSLLLRWAGCSRVVVPQEASWGRSVSINRHGRDGRRYWIEMQSGDLIEIWADDFDAK